MPARQHNSGIRLVDLLTGVLVPVSLQQEQVAGLQLDSRKIQPGDVFLAVPGLTVDGRDYIDQVLEAGASAVLAEAEGLAEKLERVDHRVIPVAHLQQRLSEAAANIYGNPSRLMRVTGITGTNGKTTCSHLLAQLLSYLDGAAGVVGTLGFGVYQQGAVKLDDFGMTTPDALTTQSLLFESLGKGVGSVAMEVSSHSLEQGRVNAVEFESAVFTNLSRDHLDYHGDMASYAEAKFRLFRFSSLKNAVMNADDASSRSLLERLPDSLDIIRYGLHAEADVTATHVKLGKSGFSADISTPWGQGHCSCGLLGEFNIGNLLAVISVAALQGYPLEDILERVPKLQPVAGRMQPVAGELNSAPSVVVDYAHTPDALQQALTTLRSHCEGRLWVVFGCGGDRDKGKRPEMGAVASTLADQVIITSDNPRSEKPLSIMLDIAESVDNGRLFEHREDAIRTAISEAERGDVILIAGKGHENYQQIGDERLPFSDTEVAQQLLEELWGGK